MDTLLTARFLLGPTGGCEMRPVAISICNFLSWELMMLNCGPIWTYAHQLPRFLYLRFELIHSIYTPVSNLITDL